MNLVEALIKADAKKAEELKTSVFLSKRLGKILGQSEAVEVKIKELPNRRVNDILAYQVDKRGEYDFSKSFDAKLMMIVEGVVEPDLKNKELQEHFGCGKARELAEKLFQSEVTELSDAIADISEVGEGSEEEIKN